MSKLLTLLLATAAALVVSAVALAAADAADPRDCFERNASALTGGRRSWYYRLQRVSTSGLRLRKKEGRA